MLGCYTEHNTELSDDNCAKSRHTRGSPYGNTANLKNCIRYICRFYSAGDRHEAPLEGWKAPGLQLHQVSASLFSVSGQTISILTRFAKFYCVQIIHA